MLRNRGLVVVRYNALSRVFESALQKEGIPCKILGGHRFFERLEVSSVEIEWSALLTPHRSKIS